MGYSKPITSTCTTMRFMSGVGRSWRPEYTVLLVCWLGWISIYLARSVLPPVIPILTEELGLSYGQAGFLETAYLIGYIIIKAPVGTLSQHLGKKRLLILSMLGYGTATLLTSRAAGFYMIAFLRFLVGLFQGVHLPITNSLLSDRFGDRQGRAIGFNESGPNVGNALAFPLTVSSVSVWSWRTAFMFLSLPAFVLAVLVALALGDFDEVKKVDEEERVEVKLRDHIGIIVPMAIAHAVYNLLLRTLFTFTPSYLVEVKGLSLTGAGWYAMVMPLAGIAAKISSGFISERVGDGYAIVGATSLSSLLLFALISSGTGTLTPVFIAMGLTLYSFSPIIYTSTASSLPSKLKPSGLGTVTMIGNTVGALSTTIIGTLIDIRGYTFSLTAMAIIGILGAATIHITYKKQQGQTHIQ